MKAKLSKCHMLLSRSEAFNVQISEAVNYNSHLNKLLGVTLGNKIRFEKHINTIYLSISRKLNTLAKITPYMELKSGYDNERNLSIPNLIIVLLSGCFIVKR